MDEDGDGAIDFDEFLVYWKRSGSKLADAINVEVSRLLTLSKTDRDKLTVAMLTVHKLQARNWEICLHQLSTWSSCTRLNTLVQKLAHNMALYKI